MCKVTVKRTTMRKYVTIMKGQAMIHLAIHSCKPQSLVHVASSKVRITKLIIIIVVVLAITMLVIINNESHSSIKQIYIKGVTKEPPTTPIKGVRCYHVSAKHRHNCNRGINTGKSEVVVVMMRAIVIVTVTDYLRCNKM